MADWKHLLSLVVFALSTTAVHAQREVYVEHNLLVDRASLAAAKNDYFLAVDLYDSAFAVMPYDPPVYFEATMAALRARRLLKANEFLKVGVEIGFDPTLFFDSAFSEFLASDASAPFKNNWQQSRLQFAEHADSVSIRKLQAMRERDQSHRDDDRMAQLNDSLNFEDLIGLSEANGFPNARSVGNSIGIAWLLLWHHRGDEYPHTQQWQRVLPFIRSAIDAGELDPSFLCMFDDMTEKEAGRPMLYGALLNYYSGTTEELLLVDPVHLQQNRSSVGWGPIDDYARVVGVDPTLIRYASP